MSTANRPVTSREYKLMLNVDRFKDLKQGSEAFRRLVEFLFKKQGSVFEEQQEDLRRRTSYLDTNDMALRRHGFALRVREESEGEVVNLNLKYRSSDRYISAAQDVSSAQGGESKFEEDILPPFVSKFSASTTITMKSPPDLRDMKKVASLFPGLGNLGIPKGSAVETVNDFRAHETVSKIGKVKFGEGVVVKASLSFWYLLGEEGELPLVGEFSFGYDAPLGGADKPKRLEQFPTDVVEGTNRFFDALQNHTGWLNFNATTKTAFALDTL